MTNDEIQRAWTLVNKYGPPNAWTAANGTLAAALGRALEEVERLKYRVAVLENNPPPEWLGRRD
jgi:hypothetical protein